MYFDIVQNLKRKYSILAKSRKILLDKITVLRNIINCYLLGNPWFSYSLWTIQ